MVKRPPLSLGSRPQSHNQIDNLQNFIKEETEEEQEGLANKKKNQCKLASFLNVMRWENTMD